VIDPGTRAVVAERGVFLHEFEKLVPFHAP
jgi:hypothetical protein